MIIPDRHRQYADPESLNAAAASEMNLLHKTSRAFDFIASKKPEFLLHASCEGCGLAPTSTHVRWATSKDR